MVIRRLLAALACVVGLLLGARAARAHDVRGTAIYLDLGDHAARAELVLPVEQLLLALDGGPLLPPLPDVSTYVGAHLSAESGDGRPFEIDVTSARREAGADGGSVIVGVTLRAPAGASARSLTLRASTIVHRVVTHDIYVFIRRDVARGALGDAVEPVGTIHWQRPTVTIDRRGGSLTRAFGAMFAVGAKHIAEGSDHLLFLAMLLLVTPLSARAGRWAWRGSATESLREAAKVVTAFTVGHSLTLIAVTLTSARLPTRLVETLIALSIAVSAAHAARPLFAGREALIAASFGLVHGLGFAEGLRDLGVGGATLGAALFGFNLGVEVAQLAVVLALSPWLVLVGRSARYTRVREAAAACGGVAALGWVAERALDIKTPIPAIVEAVAARPEWIVVALVVSALAVILSPSSGGAPARALEATRDKA